MKTPNTIESSVLETVSGGWRHHGHWRHGGSRTVVNNYWGAQPVQQAPLQTNTQFSASFRSC